MSTNEPLYSMSIEDWKEAQKIYMDQLKTEPRFEGMNTAKKAKSIVEAKKAFFSKESEELRNWLCENKFLKESDIKPTTFNQNSPSLPPLSSPGNGQTIEIPLEYFNLLVNKVGALEQELASIKQILSFCSKSTDEIAFQKYYKQNISKYSNGDMTEEEANNEIRKDWINEPQSVKAKFY